MQRFAQLLHVQGFLPERLLSILYWQIFWIQLRILDNQKEENRCSLGIPDTSFKGLRTRTARRVRKSTWVLKWVPAVARMLWAETQKSQGYHSLSGPFCFMGRLGWAGSAWKVHKASASCMWAHLSQAESPGVSSGIKYSHLGFTVQKLPLY